MKIFRGSGLVIGALGLLTGFPLAAPRSIADCEKIQATDAYNQCLASFGPVAHLKPMRPLSGGDGGSVHRDEHSHYHSRHWHRSVAPGHRHGRHVMVINIGGHGHHRHRH